MRVGFIGLGNMGRPMATNILKAGHEMVVYDIREEAGQPLIALGARWAHGPKAVAQASQVIFTSLPGPKEVEQVALGPGGILEGMHPGAVYVDLSTNSPACVRRIAAAFRAQGFAMLDAPVSGGVTGAETRDLAVLVGGDEGVFTRVKPLLDAIGTKVFYCGPSGAGSVCKIVNNLISLSLNVLIGEAFTIGVKAGVPTRILYEAVTRSSGDNARLRRGLRNQLFKGDFRPGFAVDLALKDVRLGLELARELDVPVDLLALVEQKYLEAHNRGWGQRNSDAVVLLQEERAKVELRAPDL
ncbi:MAG: NAD(P)-dependent oxidoreductase [Dehalococcoidia bacterium]|nr:NAD(P)-dependent oxidoreductase [Dehalococcoidia bacterium]MDW8119695.1 NAD(P)-dependent oxidoreductase [Chloroflexota bacterium]